MHPGSKPVSQFLRSGYRPVEHMDLGKTAVTDRLDHRAAGAAGAEDDSNVLSVVPASGSVVEIGEKAVAIGIGCLQPAIFPFLI